MSLPSLHWWEGKCFRQGKTLSEYSLMLNVFSIFLALLFLLLLWQERFRIFDVSITRRKSCFVFYQDRKTVREVYGNFIDTKMCIFRLMPLYGGSRIPFGFRRWERQKREKAVAVSTFTINFHSEKIQWKQINDTLPHKS